MKILITGGAGFIGSHLAKKLAARGDDVTVVDNLSEQIHGPGADFSPELRSLVTCVRGDGRDRSLMASLIPGTEIIVHLAAETGTGQSMYAVQRYADVNVQGTATLLDVVVNERPETLRKLVVASSRAIYGEGKYHCAEHGNVFPGPRSAASMTLGQYDPPCPVCGGATSVLPTTEDTPFAPSSFYGLTKQVQEQMVLMFAAALGLDGFALRYQNVFGPGQSLSNPYTGILAVFSNLARQGKAINVFEDGQESRDFVYVDDVVDATLACMAPEITGVHSLNVGSGVRTTVNDVAHAIARYFKSNSPIQITGAFRVGDIRHNVADIARLRALTGFVPQWSFESGLSQFLKWAERSSVVETGFERSLDELKERGLLGGKTSD